MARLSTLGVLALALRSVSAADKDYTAACKQIQEVVSGATDVVYPSNYALSHNIFTHPLNINTYTFSRARPLHRRPNPLVLVLQPTSRMRSRCRFGRGRVAGSESCGEHEDAVCSHLGRALTE